MVRRRTTPEAGRLLNSFIGAARKCAAAAAQGWEAPVFERRDESAVDRLIDTPGKAGLLARVRLAAALPYLFHRAPNWTSSRLIPLSNWSSSTRRTCGRHENTRTT